MIHLLIISTVYATLQLTNLNYGYSTLTGLSLTFGTQGNGISGERKCIFVVTLGTFTTCDDSTVGVDLSFQPQITKLDCANNIFNFTNFDCSSTFLVTLSDLTGPIYNISQDFQLDIYLFQGIKYKLTQTITQSYSLQQDDFSFSGLTSNTQAFSVTDLTLAFPLINKVILTPNPFIILNFPKYNSDISNSIYDYFEVQSVPCTSAEVLTFNIQVTPTCTYLNNQLSISFPSNTAPIQNDKIQVNFQGFRNNYIVNPISLQGYLTLNVGGQTYYSRNYLVTISNNSPKSSLQNSIILSQYGTSALSQVTVSFIAQSYLPLNSQINLEFSQNIYTDSSSTIQCNQYCQGNQPYIISTNKLTYNPQLEAYQQNVNFSFIVTNFINPSTAQTVSLNIKIYELRGSTSFILDSGSNQITFKQNSFSNINVQCQNCIFTQISNYIIRFTTPIVPKESQLQILFPSELQIQQYTGRLKFNEQYYAQVFTQSQTFLIEGLFFQNQQEITIELENVINPSYQNQSYQFSFTIFNQDKLIIETDQNFPLTFNYQDISIIESQFSLMSSQYMTSLTINITSSYGFVKDEYVYINISKCIMEIPNLGINCLLNGFETQCSQIGQVFIIQVQDYIQGSAFLIINIQNLIYPRSVCNCSIQPSTYYNQSNLKFGLQSTLEVFQHRDFLQPQVRYQNQNYYLSFIPSERFYPGDFVIVKISQEVLNDISVTYLDQNLQMNNSEVKIQMNAYNFDQMVLIYSKNIGYAANILFFDIKAYDNQGYLTMQTQTSVQIDQLNQLEQVNFVVTSSSHKYYAQSNYTIQILNNSNIKSYDTLLIQWDNNINAKNCQLIGYNANNYWYNNSLFTKMSIQQTFFDSNQTIFLSNIINPEYNQSSSLIKIMVLSSQNLTAQGVFQMGSFNCDDKCQTCYTQSICQKCQNGYYLLFSQCVSTCPQGYITTSNNDCQQCPQLNGCSQCDSKSPQLCQICRQGYILVNQTCTLQQTTNVENKLKEIQYDQNFIIIYIQLIICLILLICKIKRRALYYFKALFVIQEIQQTILEKIVLLYLFLDYNYTLALYYFSPLILDLIQIIISQQNLRKHIQFQRVSEKLNKKSSKMKLISFGIYFYNTRIIYLLETKLTDEKCFNVQLSDYKKLYLELTQYIYFYAYLISLFQLSILVVILAQGNANQFQLDYTCFFIMRIFTSFTSIYIDYREEKAKQAQEDTQMLQSFKNNQVLPWNDQMNK